MFKKESSELLLITDITKEQNNLILKTVIKFLLKSAGSLMVMQIYYHLQNYFKEKPDAVLFNLQFLKFEIKVPAALGY
jgi:hypothetical protein